MLYKINFHLARSLKCKWHQAIGVANQIKRIKHMEDRSHRTHSDAGRFGRWLSTRPAESWMFFGAGVILGGLFF